MHKRLLNNNLLAFWVVRALVSLTFRLAAHLDRDAAPHGEVPIGLIAAPRVMPVGAEIIGLGILLETIENVLDLGRRKSESARVVADHVAMKLGRVAVGDMIDRVNAPSAGLEVGGDGCGHRRTMLWRNMLKHGDRVDRVKGVFALGHAKVLRKPSANELHFRELTTNRLEFSRAVAMPLVGIDDPDIISFPGQKVGDIGIATANLQQACPARDFA